MATHSVSTSDQVQLEPGLRKVVPIGTFLGGIGIFLALALSYFVINEPGSPGHSLRRFYFGYLISYMFFLMISLGGVFFTLLQHVVRAGWSASVRRLAETFASALPTMAILSAPILLSVIVNKGDLYRWAQPDPAVNSVESRAEGSSSAAEENKAEAVPHGVLSNNEESIQSKRPYLNPAFFIVRIAIYFACWIGLGVGYWKASTRQDLTTDVSLTVSMQRYSAPALVLFAISFTLGVFDLVMSLDPTWFSTMFGVYIFAGAAISIQASMIITAQFLQSRGRLVNTVSREHFHDLGKLMFAFTFFWGYVGFSQYMLQWYGNITEETHWWIVRGASSAKGMQNGFTPIALILPICHLGIPFAGLLSRHVKRNRKGLLFLAFWMLVMEWIDLYFLIMPEYDGTFHLGLMELFCFIGVGGFWFATVVRHASQHALRADHDPRLMESLAFQNI